MTSREFSQRLTRRARKARIDLPAGLFAPLEEYFHLLTRWNRKINLTALPLQAPTDETFDRLFIEPLSALPLVQTNGSWFDLGSGGGSPAIPIKLARPGLAMTLVESRARKAAFLSEAVRTLKLPDAEIKNVRFESLSVPANSATLVTVRAVRTDPVLLGVAAHLLSDGGRLLLFGPPARLTDVAFEREAPSAQLEHSLPVVCYRRTFHVEQNR